jgi:acyl-CoA thioesterase
MDEAAARAAFETALSTHRPEFGNFFLARLLGLEISYTEETCLVRCPLRDFLFNPQGTLHGGIIATIMDISMGHLLHHRAGAGMTLEMKTQYIRAAKSGAVVAEGRFIRQGRSINFMESRLHDEAGELLAMATSTWRLLDKPAPR